MRVTVVLYSGVVNIWEDVKTLTTKEGRLEGVTSKGLESSVALYSICSWWAQS